MEQNSKKEKINKPSEAFRFKSIDILVEVTKLLITFSAAVIGFIFYEFKQRESMWVSVWARCPILLTTCLLLLGISILSCLGVFQKIVGLLASTRITDDERTTDNSVLGKFYATALASFALGVICLIAILLTIS